MNTQLPQVVEILNRVFVRKYNSLAAYILQAQPYVSAESQTWLPLIEHIAEQDALARDELAATLQQLNQIPRLEPHPEMVSDLNYISLDYLVKVLAKDLQAQLLEYQSARQLCGDHPAAGCLEGLIGLTRNQIQRLGVS